MYPVSSQVNVAVALIRNSGVILHRGSGLPASPFMFM